MDHYLASGTVDLRRAVIVVPGGRAGRRLTELLLEQADKREAILTPPGQVTTSGHLPELLYAASGPIAHPAAARVALARALQETDAPEIATVFPTLPEDAAGWGGLAEIVYRLHDELGAQGLDFEAVARQVGRAGTFDDTPRWSALAAVQVRYLRLLAASGMGDQGQARSEALAGGRLRIPGDIWLIGVVEMPRIVRQMLAASGAPVRALIHAPAERAPGFDEMGCVSAPGWEGVEVPLRDEHVEVVLRPSHQAAAVTRLLRGTEARYSAEEIVVGVPDPEVVPYLEQRLAGAGVPHRHAAGRPLIDSAPLRLLAAVAAYLDGRRFRALAALLRHPDLRQAHDASRREGGGAEAGVLETADRYFSRHLPAEVGAGSLAASQDGRLLEAMVSRLEDELSLARFKGRKPLSAWMPDVLDLLVGVYGREPLDRSSFRSRHILEACVAIKTIADVLARLPDRIDARVPAHDAIGHLLRELRTESIAPDPEREAVELVGWLELPLDDAPAVIVTGFNEPHLPETMVSDAFLPGALRTRLGLPDDRQRYARDVYLLTALVHSREQVHLVAGRNTAAGDPLRPSRLLFAAPDKIAARRILRYLGRQDHEDGQVLQPESAPRRPTPVAADTSTFVTPPEPTVLWSKPLETLRVSDFRSILQDPYRFALERLLGLQALDDAAREMDALNFGSLAHAVLEKFGHSGAADSADEQQIATLLTRILDDTVDAQFGARPVPAVRLQHRQLGSRLRAFANWHAAWIDQGWRMVGVEKSPGQGLPFVVDGECILIRGRVDRIDYHAESNRWMLFDYKTSEKAASPEKTHRIGKKDDKRWIDLQLPLYRLLLAAINNDQGSLLVPVAAQAHVGFGYILLPRCLGDVGAIFADWSADELRGAEETARAAIRHLRRGIFAFDRDTKRSSGKRCDPFDALLGRKELPLTAEATAEDPA